MVGERDFVVKMLQRDDCWEMDVDELYCWMFWSREDAGVEHFSIRHLCDLIDAMRYVDDFTSWNVMKSVMKSSFLGGEESD